MKALFMTSSLGCAIKLGDAWIPTACDNSNYFVDNLRNEIEDVKNLTIIAADPDNYFRLDSQSNCVIQGLQLCGFSVKKTNLIDHRFKENIKEAILSSDMVFLCGGHVPTQNQYFKEIRLKEILNNYKGVVVGQSAGSMNCSKMVYAQPECEEEFLDVNYNNFIEGLGLTDIIIMPHMNRAKTDELCGETTYSMCLKDSYKIPHYGITDGGYILIKNGKAEAFGETIYFKDGKEIKLCENGESFVIYEKGKENEKNN